MGGGVDEIRERTGDYGPPSGTSGQQEEHKAGSVGSTRYFDTAEGVKSYTQVAERLAVSLVNILHDTISSDPATLKTWQSVLNNDRLRKAGIGRLLVEMGKLTAEDLDRLAESYEN